MLLVLAILAAIFWLPSPWGVVAVVGAAFVELAEIGFLIWLSRRRRAVTGAEALPGSVATVVAPCDPVGQVLLDGELWWAECVEGAAKGDRVIVDRLGDRLTLIVRPFSTGS